MHPFQDIKNGRFYLGDCLEVMKEIPDDSIDCVLIDPPYIGMVNESWDRLQDSEASLFFKTLLEESYRVLRYGGRFISCASNDTIKWLHQEPLKHRELLIVDKGCANVSSGRNTKQYKQHVNHVEYVVVATKFARSHTKQLLLNAALGLKSKEINELLGVATNGGGMWSIYTGNNICEQVPTIKQWDKFKAAFPSLPNYSTFEEVFNNDVGKGNILSGFDFRMKCRIHPTQKPVALFEYLIKTYTNEGELVLDNCAGSGTTAIAAENTNRKWICIEQLQEYADKAVARIRNHEVLPINDKEVAV
jgi:site-specific DNA-methyltransferase (adenine-specific)